MSTDAEEQADEAASLEAIFGDDIKYDAGLSAYRVRPQWWHWQQADILQQQQQTKAAAFHTPHSRDSKGKKHMC
jgi:hypothetical protein